MDQKLNLPTFLFKKFTFVNVFKASKENRFKEPKGDVLGMSEQSRNRKHVETRPQADKYKEGNGNAT